MCVQKFIVFEKCGHVVKWVEYCKYCPPGSTSDKCQSPDNPRIKKETPQRKACCCSSLLCCDSRKRGLDHAVEWAEWNFNDYVSRAPPRNPALPPTYVFKRLEDERNNYQQQRANYITEHRRCNWVLTTPPYMPDQGEGWTGVRTGERYKCTVVQEDAFD